MTEKSCSDVWISFEQKQDKNSYEFEQWYLQFPLLIWLCTQQLGLVRAEQALDRAYSLCHSLCRSANLPSPRDLMSPNLKFEMNWEQIEKKSKWELSGLRVWGEEEKYLCCRLWSTDCRCQTLHSMFQGTFIFFDIVSQYQAVLRVNFWNAWHQR